MRRSFCACLFLLTLLCVSAWAKPLVFPALTGRIVDNAHLLDSETAERVEAKLEQYEHKTGEQIVVVTLPSLDGIAIEEYGYQLGRKWGIGQKEKNNGALLIVAPTEHAVRIEVGYGLEGRLTDAASSVIIQNTILPAFQENNFAAGIEAGTTAIISVLNNEADVVLAPKDQGESSSNYKLLLLFLLIFFILRRMGGGGIAGPLLLGTLFNRGGSGGGGGFSGGGGSFGGGGSSGSW